MALFRGIQEYIALDANNITLVFDSGNIVNISGNIFLYPPQGHPILYKCPICTTCHHLKGKRKRERTSSRMTSVDSDLDSCTLTACGIPSRLKSIFKYKSLCDN